MVLEVALFPVEQKISEAKKWKNKFDHKLDTKWSKGHFVSLLLLFINWSFKRQGTKWESKLWYSQNHFESLYFKSFFAFKFLTCIIRSWLLSLLKEYATRHIWPRKVDTCFLSTFERDERTESEVTQRPSYAAETTQDVAVMMQGMFHVKRKVPGSSSLVRCDGPSVWSARSFTRTELHWNCCWWCR